MKSTISRRPGFIWGLALLVAGSAGCGEVEKSGPARAAHTESVATKVGPSRAVMAAELSTAMVNGEAAKGTSSIGPGQSLRGSLGPGDGQRGDGSLFDSWVFVLGEATDVAISLTSASFDAYLSVFEGAPGTMGDLVGSDDDGGDGTDSFLEVHLSAGTYTALANSFAAGETGAYEIRLAIADQADEWDIRSGQTVTGTLSTSDQVTDDGHYYQVWDYYGRGGERVTATLRSGDFDTVLFLEMADEVLVEDDDGGGGTDSSITYTLPEAGWYYFVVDTYAAGETGTYTLVVQGGSPAAPFAGFGSGGPSNGRYALLVGIDDYPGTGSDLRGPVEDARILERVLIDRFGFDPANVVTLNDSDATRENIAQGVARHLGQAGPDGVAVFFYSGHGTQIGENIGLTGSLDPEPRGDGDEAIYIYGPNYDSSVILDEELGYLIETIDAGRTLVIVDACFSGEITRASGDAPQSKVVDLDDPAVADNIRLPTSFITSELKALNLDDLSLGFGDFQAIAEVFRNPQRHIMWGASTEDQVSWTSGLGNGASVFAYYVGERMMSAPTSTTFADLNRAVHDDVVRYIEGNGNMTMQNPQMRGPNASMTLEDFFRQR